MIMRLILPRLAALLILLLALLAPPARAEYAVGDACTGSNRVYTTESSSTGALICNGSTLELLRSATANPSRQGFGVSSPAYTLDVGGTDAIRIPLGTTAQRPTGAAGVVRYNSTLGALEFHNGTAWVAIGGAGAAAFNFTDQTGASTSSTISSNAVTLSGFTGSLTAVCGTGCTAISRNGSWGGTSVGGFVAGDTIAMRQTSSASLGTATTATVAVGSTTSGAWTVTTTASTPNAFSFTDVTGATAGITYSSNAVTLAGFSGSLTATCTGACVSIARNGVWGGTATSGFVSGDTIALRVVSGSGTGTAVTATATVGNTTSSTWTVTNSTTCTVSIGAACADGTLYAGLSPDGNVPIYTTPCDVGYYWNGSACTACSSGLWSGSGSTCSTTYSSNAWVTWNNGTSNWTTTGYTSSTTGLANTSGLAALVDIGSPHKAASYCDALTAYTKSDWYLPAKDELNALYINKTAIGNFDVTSGNTANGSGSYPGYYWSSTEYAIQLHVGPAVQRRESELQRQQVQRLFRSLYPEMNYFII